jgi:uncharacterized protein
VNLAGRTVLLTGATGGIGHAIARRLRAMGAEIVITGRRGDVLEPLAAETGARAIAVDLAEPGATERLAEACGDVDVLVANAALPASGDIASFSVQEIDRALAVNLRAPIVLARLLGERMAERGEGHLVFISSLAGKAGSPGGSIYSATKFGLRGFAQGLRGDLRPRGVGVSVVFPGFVRDAGMFHDSGARLPRFVGTSTADEVAAGVVRAIERDRAELDVAPLSLRAGVVAAGLAPELATAVQRRLGGDKVSAALSAAQSAKR